MQFLLEILLWCSLAQAYHSSRVQAVVEPGGQSRQFKKDGAAPRGRVIESESQIPATASTPSEPEASLVQIEHEMKDDAQVAQFKKGEIIVAKSYDFRWYYARIEETGSSGITIAWLTAPPDRAVHGTSRTTGTTALRREIEVPKSVVLKLECGNYHKALCSGKVTIQNKGNAEHLLRTEGIEDGAFVTTVGVDYAIVASNSSGGEEIYLESVYGLKENSKVIYIAGEGTVPPNLQSHHVYRVMLVEKDNDAHSGYIKLCSPSESVCDKKAKAIYVGNTLQRGVFRVHWPLENDMIVQYPMRISVLAKQRLSDEEETQVRGLWHDARAEEHLGAGFGPLRVASDLCSLWPTVICMDGHVVGLYLLGDMNLDGTIEALRGLKLTSLDIRHTAVTGDISALQDMPLVNLNLDQTKVSGDIRVLRNMPIENIKLLGTGCTGNLESLKDLTTVKYVKMAATEVFGDIAALQASTKLHYVNFGLCRGVSGDLRSLKDFSMGVVDLEETEITGDLGLLYRSKQLQWLNVGKTGIHGDIAALQFAKASLRQLLVSKSKVTGDIANLQNFGLEVFKAADTEVAGSLQVFEASMPGLKELDLSRTKVSGGIEALSSLKKLRELRLTNTDVDGALLKWNGSGRSWVALETLDISHSRVAWSITSPTHEGYASDHMKYVPPFNKNFRHLDVSATSVNLPVQKFLEAFMWNENLDTLIANEAGLSGPLHFPRKDLLVFKVPKDGFFQDATDGAAAPDDCGCAYKHSSTLPPNLRVVSLKRNPITELSGSLPEDLGFLSLAHRADAEEAEEGFHVTTEFFDSADRGNVVDLRDVACPRCDVARESGGAVQVFPTYQCRDSARKRRFLIWPHVFAPRRLCECSPGFFQPADELEPLACQQCPENSFASRPGQSACMPCLFFQKTNGKEECRVSKWFVMPFVVLVAILLSWLAFTLLMMYPPFAKLVGRVRAAVVDELRDAEALVADMDAAVQAPVTRPAELVLFELPEGAARAALVPPLAQRALQPVLAAQRVFELKLRLRARQAVKPWSEALLRGESPDADKVLAAAKWTEHDRDCLLKLVQLHTAFLGTYTGALLAASGGSLQQRQRSLLHGQPVERFLAEELEQQAARFRAVYAGVHDAVLRLQPQYAEAVARAASLPQREARQDAGAFPLGTRDAVALVEQAAVAQERTAALALRLAERAGATVAGRTLKPLHRVVEKSVLLGRGPPDVTGVLDCAREALEFPAMAALLRGLEELQACERRGELTLLAAKNRWATPTICGWADCLVYFAFSAGPAQGHVCELQFAHEKLARVRDEMGAYDAYLAQRLCAELAPDAGADAARAGARQLPGAQPEGPACGPRAP